MSQPLSVPLPALDFDTAAALCDRISHATQSISQPHELLALVENCVTLGWSPYLHDHVLASGRASHTTMASHLFSSCDAQAPAFAKILKLFPATVSAYFLFGAALTSQSNPDLLARLLDAPAAQWHSLGPRQRAELILFSDGIFFALPDSLDLRAIWIRCAAAALLPPQTNTFNSLTNVDTNSTPPFYGFFQTCTWHKLKANQPEAAHDLSLYLYIHGALHGSENGLAPDAWTLAAAHEARAAPGPFALHAGPNFRALLHAATINIIEHDASDYLLPLVDAIGIAPLDNEVKLLEKCEPQLRERINASSRGARGFLAKRFGSIKFGNLNVKDFGLSAIDPGPVQTLPLFTLSAVCGSELTWDALCLRWPPPLELSYTANHLVKLASPSKLKLRLTHMLSTVHYHSKNPEAAIKTLSDNLLREQRRACFLVAMLPLPDDMRAELMSDCTAPLDIPPLRVPPGIQHSFPLACQKAALLAQNGQAAPLLVPLPFDWALHLLAAGTKPSFLLGKLEPGNLAHAARIFGLADPHRTSAGFFDSRETAALDKDELSPLLSKLAPTTALRVRL